MASGNNGGVERKIAIISIIIALLSVSFTAGHLFTTREHNRFNETYNSLAMLYDRLVDYRVWVINLQEDDKAKATPYYLEAANRFREAEQELRKGNFDLALGRIGEAYVILEEGRAAVEVPGLWAPR